MHPRQSRSASAENAPLQTEYHEIENPRSRLLELLQYESHIFSIVAIHKELLELDAGTEYVIFRSVPSAVAAYCGIPQVSGPGAKRPVPQRSRFSGTDI